MNSAKKARLESKGWRVGDAQDFLKLSREEAQTQVAELLGSSQSRVAKMESGDPSVSIDLLLRAVLAIGETPKTIVKVLAAAAA